MIPGTNGSSAGSPKGTYAIINQGASANSLWYDIKTLRWAVEPGETLFIILCPTLIESVEPLPSSYSSSPSYCTSIGRFSLHILPKICQIHLHRLYSYPTTFQPLPLTIPVMPKDTWTWFSLHIISYFSLLPDKLSPYQFVGPSPGILVSRSKPKSTGTESKDMLWYISA